MAFLSLQTGDQPICWKPAWTLGPEQLTRHPRSTPQHPASVDASESEFTGTPCTAFSGVLRDLGWRVSSAAKTSEIAQNEICQHMALKSPLTFLERN